MNEISEEKAAHEEAKRMQEAEYANTYTGQASAVVSSLWSWGASGETEDESKGKKKKKKKKKENDEVEEAPAAPAAPAALPTQLQNLTPQQLAAVRAMQARQMAARQQQ
jgi:hypothetical protein